MRLLFIVLLYSGWLTSPPLPAGAPAAASDWKMYSNDNKGLSFRYPPYLHVIERSLEDFRMEGLVLVLDVTSPKHPGSAGLRFLVTDHSRSSMTWRQDFSSLRKICKSYFELRLGGRRAANCVTCGRGACAWKIVIPGEMELTIHGPGRDQPQNGTYPLLSIIRTVSFKAGQ